MITTMRAMLIPERWDAVRYGRSCMFASPIVKLPTASARRYPPRSPLWQARRVTNNYTSCSMGCITASGYRLGQSIEVSAYKATPSVAASGFSRYAPLQVSGVAVCHLTTASYLEITPQVIWLTESNGYSDYFDVESNTDWKVFNE